MHLDNTLETRLTRWRFVLRNLIQLNLKRLTDRVRSRR